MQSLYTAHATSSGAGRDGHVATDDGLIELDLAIQKELGGPGGKSNPEQLFAAGYAACFHSALKRVAGSQGLDAEGSSITAQVGLGVEGSAFGLAVTLVGALPALDAAAGEKLMHDAHQVCPYSRATRGNVEVTLQLA